MIYFALNEDGLLYNLGDHGDYESADCTAQDMQLNAIWLIGENEARNMAEFITEQLANTISTN
jgi:hypothetical protein